MDEEVRKYDPFGRGGGGAPMKDTEGNVIGMSSCLSICTSLGICTYK